MGKPHQVLIIEPPSELRFRGPFTDTSITSYMKLINPSNHTVFFKIKTTAPKKYCVRPNAGVIKPKTVTQIAVTLQPLDFNPTEKSKHKFMVQALIADDFTDDDFPRAWKEPNPDQIMESKLKCVFEYPITNTTIAKTTSTTTTTESEVNTNSDKTKGVGDIVESSSKVLGDAEVKLYKAAQEVSQLRAEESTLRQENLQLKEDLLKLRNAALGNDATLAATRALTSQTSRQLPPITINAVLVIVMAIIGYLLGKMF